MGKFAQSIGLSDESDDAVLTIFCEVARLPHGAKRRAFIAASKAALAEARTPKEAREWVQAAWHDHVQGDPPPYTNAGVTAPKRKSKRRKP